MQTPLKPTRKAIEIRSVKINYSTFFNYTALMGCAIVLGSVLQILFAFEMTLIGKNSILTGIPLLRNTFFAFPIIMNILLLVWLITIFRDPEISTSMNENIWRLFHKVRLGFLLTNFTLTIIFYFIYYYLYVPLWLSHEFRLSGHVLACAFSGASLLNLISVFEMFKAEGIKKKMMDYLIKASKFLLYHNLYTIIWTAWVFHKVRETIFSFFFAFFIVLMIISLNIDRLVVFLMNKEAPKRFKGKERNKIIENYETL